MRTIITFLVLMLSILSLSAQDQIPAKEYLYGEWQLISHNFRTSDSQYMLCSNNKDFTDNDIQVGAKVTISKEGVNKNYNVEGAWCGNDHRRMYNRAHGKQITPISYDEIEGVLELSVNHIFGHTLFLLHKLPSGNIILTKIE